MAQNRARGFKHADVEFFTYQLATLVNSHVPLRRALEVTPWPGPEPCAQPYCLPSQIRR